MAENGAVSKTGLLTTARHRGAGILATVISVVTTVVVATLAVHILFVAFEANASNALVGTIADWAEAMAWQFKDIFQPSEPKIGVAVNYGLAGAVYLVVGRLLTSGLRRFAPE
jgi:hypothetical protein